MFHRMKVDAKLPHRKTYIEKSPKWRKTSDEGMKGFPGYERPSALRQAHSYHCDGLIPDGL